jgi:opacity protein-like surface antigen
MKATRRVKSPAGRLLAAAAAFALVLALVAILAGPAGADDVVQINELVKNMSKYDGKVVTIQGEVIGDLMVRGTYAWITVNDDRYSKKSVEEGGELIGMSNSGIGVWVPVSDTAGINMYGGYKSKGADVRVTGIFHRACHEHGGDTDIHATSLEVLKPGYPFHHNFPYGRLLAVIVLTCVIGLLWYWRSVNTKKYAKRE